MSRNTLSSHVALDPQVDAPSIQNLLSELRRHGPADLLKDLERQEPVLATYLVEAVCNIYNALEVAVPAENLRRSVQAETFALSLTIAHALLRTVVPAVPHDHRASN